MPSKRKRIGFLPRLEVQDIIDKICEHNKLSQSKVTGILVEEALTSRRVINSSLNSVTYDLDCNNSKFLFVNNEKGKNNTNKENDNLKLDDSYIKDEVQMIKAFIEFKLFKNIMNKNKKDIYK